MQSAKEQQTSVEESIRLVGLKATLQRVRIVQALARAGAPVSLEKLHGLVEGGVDLSTLYRNMKDFTETGLVRVVDLRHGHAHYELAYGTEHHHIVCTSCGMVEDFMWPHCPEVAQHALKTSRAFVRVQDHAMEVYGTCRACA